MKVRIQISCAALAACSLMAAGQQPAPATTPQVDQPQTQTQTQTQPQPAPASTVPDTTATPGQDKTTTDPATAPDSQVAPKPPATSPTGTTPAGVDNAHYVIGAEDSLQITVWREPSLSGTFPVRPDGMITMVLLGDLRASGMTPMQLGADISQRLHKFVQDPSVTVQVLGVNSQRVYLIGEVGHVGPINLAPSMTPLQAIASAGGLSPFANTKHIYILRGTGPTPQKIPFRYKQALKGDNSQQIVLLPGDTIVVP